MSLIKIQWSYFLQYFHNEFELLHVMEYEIEKLKIIKIIKVIFLMIQSVNSLNGFKKELDPKEARNRCNEWSDELQVMSG